MFRILVVDDEPGAAHLLKQVARHLQHRYELYFAEDGLDALDFLYGRGAHGGAVRPDLILLDMHMPRLDGLETLSVIKNDPDLCVIPVIVLSSAASPELVRRSYEAHANCYVLKPSDLDEARKLVEAVEAFWMDFAHRPLPAHLPERPGARSFGQRIALHPTEVSGRPGKHDSPPDEPMKARYRKCEEHNRLLDEFGAGVRVVLQLHEQQFMAIIEGDVDASRFDLLIHMANETKQQAKYAYLRHIEEHGC